MPERHQQNAKKTRELALCAMIAALGIVVMLLGSVISIASYCTPLLAGVLLLPVMLEFGLKQAWMTWAVTALLALMIGVDQEAAFFYIFIGYYPMLKPRIDKIPKSVLRYLAKFALFCGAIGAMYCLLYFVLHLPVVVNEMQESTLAMVLITNLVLVFCLMVYDRLIVPLMLLYVNRIKPKLRIK